MIKQVALNVPKSCGGFSKFQAINNKYFFGRGKTTSTDVRNRLFPSLNGTYCTILRGLVEGFALDDAKLIHGWVIIAKVKGKVATGQKCGSAVCLFFSSLPRPNFILVQKLKPFRWVPYISD